MSARLMPAALALALGGCASVDPGPAIGDVSRTVAERSGAKAAWVRGEAEAHAVAAQVRALLAGELTAARAAQVALLNNRSLQAELEEIGIRQADLAQASRIANPDLHSFVRFPNRDDASANFEVALVQDVLDVLMQPLRKKVAAAQLEEAKLRLGDRMLRLVAETKAAYHTLVARQQLTGRLELIRDINQAAAEFAERQHEAGNLNDLDLTSHQAAYGQSRVDLALAQVEVRRDRERVDRLLGLWGPDTVWSAPSRLPDLPEKEIPLERLESRAVEQRLDLEAARFSVDVIGRAIALKRGTRYFPVGIQVGLQHERETDGVRVTGPSLALQLPIFDTGKASLARLLAEHRRAQRQLEALAIDARSEVREARDLMLATRDLAQYHASVLLPQRVKILAETQLHYNMMLKGVYDLLQAKQAEVQAETAYVAAWRDYWLSRTELERAVGGRLPEARERQTPEGEGR